MQFLKLLSAAEFILRLSYYAIDYIPTTKEFTDFAVGQITDLAPELIELGY